MVNINEYLNDGANWQAQAVLAYIKGNIFSLENFVKYDNNLFYKAKVGRYENCREQGYVFSIQVVTHKVDSEINLVRRDLFKKIEKRKK